MDPQAGAAGAVGIAVIGHGRRRSTVQTGAASVICEGLRVRAAGVVGVARVGVARPMPCRRRCCSRGPLPGSRLRFAPVTLTVHGVWATPVYSTLTGQVTTVVVAAWRDLEGLRVGAAGVVGVARVGVARHWPCRRSCCRSSRRQACRSRLAPVTLTGARLERRPCVLDVAGQVITVMVGALGDLEGLRVRAAGVVGVARVGVAGDGRAGVRVVRVDRGRGQAQVRAGHADRARGLGQARVLDAGRAGDHGRRGGGRR